MARQRIHNRRASRGVQGGFSWISYSDMMAALLLIFVLVLTYSLYQYFTMLETKTKELNDQQIVLDQQAIDLRLGVNTSDMSEEESERKVLSVCTSCIDSARPFFIGLLGKRYGFCADRPHCQTVAESLSRAGQIGGPSGLCRAYEQPDCDGRGDGSTRPHLYLT